MYSKLEVGEQHYLVGKNNAKMLIYCIIRVLFCLSCSIQLRSTPIDTKDKAKIKRRLQKTSDALTNESIHRRKDPYKGNRILARIYRYCRF
jgi:hypothetical protein